MNLLGKYEFLEEVGILPKLVAASLQYLGIKEYPGIKSNNPIIMSMAVLLNIANIYPNDETAWCALYHTFLLKITGKPLPVSGGGYYYLRASTYSTWGKEVMEGEEKLGDTLVFSRKGGNHVGLYIAESNNTFHVLGGNQGNTVSITEIDKSRLISAANYYKTSPPESVKKYFIDTTGKLSTNEA